MIILIYHKQDTTPLIANINFTSLIVYELKGPSVTFFSFNLDNINDSIDALVPYSDSEPEEPIENSEDQVCSDSHDLDEIILIEALELKDVVRSNRGKPKFLVGKSGVEYSMVRFRTRETNHRKIL